jgi:lipoprotein-anchoring transpeptidase ErfK/SrfK
LVGRLHVASIVPNPDYTFEPSRFRQTAEVRQIRERLRIPPGPNNPVGVVWLGLDRPGYGIHGTPHPELVGQAESLGCFRLTNWDAELLSRLAWVGMPVDVVP